MHAAHTQSESPCSIKLMSPLAATHIMDFVLSLCTSIFIFFWLGKIIPKERNYWIRTVWRTTKIQIEKYQDVHMNVLLKRLYQFDFNNSVFLFNLWIIPLQELNVHHSRLFCFFPKTITLSPRHIWEIYACLCLASLPPHGLMNSVSSNSPTLCTSVLYEQPNVSRFILMNVSHSPYSEVRAVTL